MIRDYSTLKWAHLWSRANARRPLFLLLLVASLATPAFAGGPWENAVEVLKQAFTGPIARGLSLVAIVVGGIAFAFGEGDAKRTFGGILFGVGMAIGATNFMLWLFP